jgi:PKD repeat protein
MYVVFILLIFCTKSLQAQLQASFTISKEGGCKPHTVQFTNTSTGTLSGVTYSWDLGNGNTSALVSPGATYVEEKVYTVTLTAKQGSETSVATRQITVYKTPSVDFAATPAKGCMPLEVSFTATVTPGDGTISRYFWDFGDGETEEGPSLTTPKHTYTFAQQAPVSLTVTNSFGCFNTRTYSGMVEVYQEVKADFTINPVRTCTPADTVSFTNKSKAPTGTKWLWDFGDGKTSEVESPKHVYEKEGTFIIKLKATTPDGCINIYQNTEPLQVANTEADFLLAKEACSQNRVKAINLSAKPFFGG